MANTLSGGEPASYDPPDPYQFTPLPGGATGALSVKSNSTLTPLLCDERAIGRLLSSLLSKGGLSVGEASRRLGVSTQAVRQYLKGRRNKPSLLWFIRFADMCGARVILEFPSSKLGQEDGRPRL